MDEIIDDDPLAELNDLAEHINASIDSDLRGHEISFGELTLKTRPDRIVHVLKFLRDDSQCRFIQLMDICGVDYPARQSRFDVVFHLLSLHNNARVRVKCAVGEGETIPSVVGATHSDGLWI